MGDIDRFIISLSKVETLAINYSGTNHVSRLIKILGMSVELLVRTAQRRQASLVKIQATDNLNGRQETWTKIDAETVHYKLTDWRNVTNVIKEYDTK